VFSFPSTILLPKDNISRKINYQRIPKTRRIEKRERSFWLLLSHHSIAKDTKCDTMMFSKPNKTRRKHCKKQRKKIYSNEICNYGIMKKQKSGGKVLFFHFHFWRFREGEKGKFTAGCGLNILFFVLMWGMLEKQIEILRNIIYDYQQHQQEDGKVLSEFQIFLPIQNEKIIGMKFCLGNCVSLVRQINGKSTVIQNFSLSPLNFLSLE
jgi:hypothetical protein